MAALFDIELTEEDVNVKKMEALRFDFGEDADILKAQVHGKYLELTPAVYYPVDNACPEEGGYIEDLTVFAINKEGVEIDITELLNEDVEVSIQEQYNEILS